MTLEKSVENIEKWVPDVKDCVSTAKLKSKERSTSLTEDETASIYLYSMPVAFLIKLFERKIDKHLNPGLLI